MPWRLEGTYFENCPCDMVCPCTTSGITMPADTERCRVVLVYHIDSGEVDGVDVSGLTVAVLADTPRVMADGNWRVGMFMDAAASEEQADKLGAVFSGQLGGPPEALSGLIGENLGVEVAPIEYADDGRRHRVRIGDLAEIEIEDFVPPQTPEGEVSKLTGIFHPANSTLTIARATPPRGSTHSGFSSPTKGRTGTRRPSPGRRRKQYGTRQQRVRPDGPTELEPAPEPLAGTSPGGIGCDGVGLRRLPVEFHGEYGDGRHRRGRRIPLWLDSDDGSHDGPRHAAFDPALPYHSPQPP